MQYDSDDRTFRVIGRQALFTVEGYLEWPGQAQFAVGPNGESLYLLRAILQGSTARIMLVDNLLAEIGTATSG